MHGGSILLSSMRINVGEILPEKVSRLVYGGHLSVSSQSSKGIPIWPTRVVPSDGGRCLTTTEPPGLQQPGLGRSCCTECGKMQVTTRLYSSRRILRPTGLARLVRHFGQDKSTQGPLRTNKEFSLRFTGEVGLSLRLEEKWDRIITDLCGCTASS
jgi:hypothetical protein